MIGHGLQLECRLQLGNKACARYVQIVLAGAVFLFVVLPIGIAALIQKFYIKVEQGTALIVNDMS